MFSKNNASLYARTQLCDNCSSGNQLVSVLRLLFLCLLLFFVGFFVLLVRVRYVRNARVLCAVAGASAVSGCASHTE